ncbi:nuclear transport factor 2 family protein [Novosphingobium sp. FKTRR1]|uniref:nuclear transport factor 2 family protein n=1 Tax=unclassified Novosphingobium TaxID=2644732 RepID=UPI001CF01507|nr:nuclear transport factor 2 family protein [Novosphingobium sp. FKTRR1]
MAYTLQNLSDIEEIKVLKHRYFRGIDTADMALLGGLFTEDVAVVYDGGTYRVSLAGREAMLEFIANSFHSGAAAMHVGLMPEIAITGDNSATGIWYLQDVFIDLEKDDHTFGTAIYTDTYRREGGAWKIASTHYDRVIEVLTKFSLTNGRVSVQRLATTGRKPDERTDISHLIHWDE